MNRSVRIRVHRTMLSDGATSGFQDFHVPWVEGMSVMDALDYIYENVDGSLAYYDHAACNQGICRRCLARINGEAALMCQTPVCGDAELAPLPSHEIERDLVTTWGRLGDAEPNH